MKIWTETFRPPSIRTVLFSLSHVFKKKKKHFTGRFKSTRKYITMTFCCFHTHLKCLHVHPWACMRTCSLHCFMLSSSPLFDTWSFDIDGLQISCWWTCLSQIWDNSLGVTTTDFTMSLTAVNFCLVQTKITQCKGALVEYRFVCCGNSTLLIQTVNEPHCSERERIYNQC